MRGRGVKIPKKIDHVVYGWPQLPRGDTSDTVGILDPSGSCVPSSESVLRSSLIMSSNSAGSGASLWKNWNKSWFSDFKLVRGDNSVFLTSLF